LSWKEQQEYQVGLCSCVTKEVLRYRGLT
jgi:hypothetical protein